MLRRRLVIPALLASSALMSLPAYGALQGLLGPVSKGEIGIRFTKTEVTQISGLSDLYLPLSPDGAPVTWMSAACVYSTQPGGYRIAAAGSQQADGAFVMSDGEAGIPYEVEWNAGGYDSAVALAPGVSSAIPADSARGCFDARPGYGASLIIRIPENAAGGRPGGNAYTDSLTLLIAPT